MLKVIPFNFESHIEYLLDFIEEATPSSWPDVIRTDKMRKIDYEHFKCIDLNINTIKMLINEDEIIGFLWCDIGFNKIEEKKYCHGDFIYVIPKCRNKGYGKYLMNELEEIGRYNHADVITLEVTISNKSAVHLYENEGYNSTRYIMKKNIT